jgi:N-acetylmuramoyl-L-alanine amidase
MYRVIAFLFVIFFTACATVPRGGGPSGYAAGEYFDIDSFCKKYNFRYTFDTLDDIVNLSSAVQDIRLFLNSPAVYYNGSFLNLKNSPFYSKGKIYVPRELERFISSKPNVIRPSFSIHTIVIDPGHGGHDPGAISCRGTKEKNLNLSVAQHLKEALEDKGYKVFLTRYGDTFLSLQERVDIAKEHNADLFISIHTNANRSRSLDGVEVYYLSPSRLNSEERAIALANEKGFWRGDLPLDVKAILWDLSLIQNYTLSIDFSQGLYSAFKHLGFKVRIPKRAPFYVLRLAYVPSVLVEIGYLSNIYEEKILRRTSYQKQIAEAITLGVVSMSRGSVRIVQDNAR